MTIVASVHGRLGGDPEHKTASTGRNMVRASLAVDVTGHNAEGEESLWVSVLAFGRVAEALARASKGETMAAMGKLTRGRFTGRDGQERESWTLIADAVVTARSARPAGRKASKADDSARQHRAAQRVQAPEDFNDELSF